MLTLNTRRGWGLSAPASAWPIDSEPLAFIPRGVVMGPTNSQGRQVTPNPELLLLVSRWRARAQELLAQAETMRDAEARQKMIEVAASYERLAQRVERGAGRADEA